MMKKVVFITIKEYDAHIIKECVSRVLQEHFGLREQWGKHPSVLLKPNLLMAAPPESAVATHPVFAQAIGMIFKELGCSVALADSPGGFGGHKSMDQVYEESGMAQMARRCGFDLLYSDKSFQEEGFPFCWWVNPAKVPQRDNQQPEHFAIVNLPKLKTHGIAVLTLATKNLYGCISGLYKSYLHKVNPRTEDLARVLVKVYTLVRPTLHIVDGILGMEGEGPARLGTPRHFGVVVVGDDALAVDYAIGKRLGLPPELHPLIAEAQKQGLFREEEVAIINEGEPFSCTDFKFPGPFFLNKFPKPLLAPLKVILRFYPHVNPVRCVGCGDCQKICPVQTIHVDEGKAVIGYRKCIVCMCCNEACRYGAIDLKKSFLINLIKAVGKGVSLIKKFLKKRRTTCGR